LAKDRGKSPPSGKGKFEALKYVKQFEKKFGPKDEPPKKEETGKETEEDKKVLTLIKEAENELLALKEKVDTKNLENMLQDASDALKDGDHPGAMAAVAKLREEIDKVVESHIEKRFFDAEMLIIELEVVGIDVSSSKNIVEEGKKALKEKRLKEALISAETAASEVEKLQKQQVMEVMTYATSIIESLKAFHVEVDEFEAAAEETKKELESKHFEKAMELVIGLESEVSTFRVHKFDELVAQTREIIATKEEAGKDVAEAQSMLKRALQSIEVKDFEAASEYLIESRYAADKEAGLEFKAKSGLRASNERYDDLKQQGINSALCEEHLKLAVAAIQKKDFDEALMEAKKAEAAALTAVREHDRITKRIASVVANKELASSVGCNLMETDNLLEQAKASLDKGEFELAQDFGNQADEELARSVQIKAKGEREELAEAARAVHDAKVDGQLTEAMELIETGKVERGFQLIQKVRSRLAGAVEKIKNLKESLATIQENIERLALEGVDISEAMDLIEKVQSAMAGGDFAKARSEFYHAEKLVGQWTADRVYDTLCSIEKDIGAFERFGLPPPAVDEMLNESWSYFVRGEKEKAAEISSQVLRSVGDYKKGFTSAMDTIQTAQHRIHHAYVMGIGINGAVTTLDKAFDQVAVVDFAGSTESANKAIADVLSAEQKAVKDHLKSTEDLIVAMESNFPVPLARDRFSRAKALLELGAYYNTYTELSQATDYLNDLKEKLQRMDINFEEVSSLLHMGEAMDVDIGAFKNLVDEARSNKESGNLNMAVSLLDQVREDIIEIYGTRISEKKGLVTGIIKSLEAKHVDVEEPRKNFKDSEGYLSSKDYINAFISLSDAHKGLLELAEQLDQATKALSDLSARLDRAAGYKLDTRRLKDRLGKAQAALATGQLTDALNASAEADSDIKDGLVKLVDMRMKEDLEEWIDRARAFNLKVKDAEHFLELAKSERDEEDYEAALENIEQGVGACKTSIKKTVDAELEAAGEAIGSAREAGISPGPVAKILDRASKAIEDERFEEASKSIKELQKGLAEQRDNHTKAQVAFDECEHKIAAFQQEGANLKTALDTLDAAKQSMASGEYDLAMDLISQSSDTSENVHKSYREAKKSIEEALGLIENLTELDIDTLTLTEESTKVYDYIDQGEYSTAIEKAYDLRDQAERSRVEHYETRLKELKEKMATEEAKKEDVSGIKEHIGNLESALMSHEFNGLSQKVDDGHTMLAELGKRYEVESKKVIAVEKELAKFEKKGTILLESRRLLDEAKAHLEDRDYAAMTEGLSAARAAATAAENARVDAKIVLEKGNAAIDLPFEELDNSGLVKLSKEAKANFADGHYEDARKLADNIFEEAKRLQTELLSTKLAEFESLKDEVEADGVNITPAKEQVKEVAELLKDGSFVPAYDFCKEALETTKRLRTEHTKAKDLLDKLEQMIAEAKAMTVGTETAEETVKDINEAFTLPDYSAGGELAQHAMEDLATDRDAFFTSLAGSIEESIIDAKGMLVPVNRPSELLKEGRGLLDNKLFLDAYKTLLEAQKVFGEVKKDFDEWSTKVAELQTSIAEAKDNGVAVDKIEAVMEKVREALSEGRFDDVERAVKGTTEGLNRAWNASASKRMEEVQAQIKVLEDAGVPTSEVKELFQGTSTALEVGEFREVLAICSTTMDMVGARRQEHDRARLAVEDAHKLMDSLEGIPAELAPIRSKLEQAEALLREGKLDDAETEAKAVKEDTDTIMMAFLKARLDKVQGEVDDALEAGAKSADLDFTTRSIDALSEKNYRNAWDIILAGEASLKDVLGAYRAAREALEKSTNLVYEAEQELELSSALECIDQANSNLESGDYRASEELSMRAVKELEKATKHYLDAQLSSTELLIKRLEMGGKVKLVEAASLQSEAKGAFEKEDVEGTKALLRKAAREAKRSRANYEIAKEVISALEEVFSAEPLNLNILKKGRERAKAAFERDYDKLLDKDEEVAPQGPIAAQLILRYQVKFEESIKIDIDITKAKKVLAQAITALENNVYNEAVRLAKEGYETVRQSERTATMRTLISMQERLDDIKEKGVDVSIQENLLERARTASYEGDTGTAFRYMNECNESLAGLKDEHKETAEALRHAESALLIAGHMGVDAPAAIEIISSANTMMEEDDYESAKDLSRQGLQEVYKAKHEKVSARHGEVSAYLDSIEKEGVPVHRAKHLLRKAKDLLETQDYIRALHLAERADAEARQMAKMHADVKDIMNATNEKIDYAKSLGVEMAAIEALQARMGATLATGKHDKVKDISAEIESELLSKIVEQCNKTIREAQDKLKEVEGLGINVETFKGQVTVANKALEEEDFDTVMSTTKGIISSVDEVLSKEVMARMEKLKSHLADAAKAGLKVPGGEELLKTAEEASAAGNSQKALEALNELGESLKSERLKKVKELLSATDKMVKAGEKEKIDVFAAKGFLDEANDALSREEIDEAFDFAVQGYNGVKDIHLNYINGILTMSKQILELAVETGGDTKRVESFLEKTQELIDKDNFDRALFYAKQCAREADRLQFKLIQSLVTKLEGEIATDDGKDYSKAKELLEEAKSALLTKKYDLARETVLKCRDEISRAVVPQPKEPEKPTAPDPELAQLESQAGDMMASALEIVQDLKKEEVDVTDLDAIYAEAKKAFAEGDFIVATEEAEKVKKMAEERKARLFGNASATSAPKPVTEEKPAVPEPKPVPEQKPTQPPTAAPATNLEGRFKTVNALLEEAEGFGLDIEVFKMEVHNAKEAINQNRASEAESTLKGLEERIMVAMAQYTEVDSAVTEVDKLLTIAANYSFDIQRPQTTYQQGLGMRKTNMAGALGSLKTAKEEVLAILEGVYPYITFDMVKDRPLVSGSWNDTYVYVSNTGNILARELTLTIEGADLEGPVILPKITIGETREVPIKLRPEGQGQQTLKAKVTFLRDFDSRLYAAEFPQIIVVTPGGPGAKSIGGSRPAKPTVSEVENLNATRCQLCQGDIKQGQYRVSCSCGKAYHETCASKIGDCVFCNKPLQNIR
jgi:hypothetical protein